MAGRLYELRVLRAGVEVPVASRVQCALDLADVGGAADLLDRHLHAAAQRCGLDRAAAHLLHLEVRPVERSGYPARDVLLVWALPLPPGTGVDGGVR